MKPPLPANEAERLRSLRSYRILDTASEQSFDDLTRLAAAICETPISMISLIDEDRQWFKARVGLNMPETARDVAFCAHAILQDDLMVVEDATADPRFSVNPLVTSDPSIRFYAGAPLVVSDGQPLGALCVIDRKPRRLSEQQLEALRVLRRAVVTQIELRRAVEELQALNRVLPICARCRSIKVDEVHWRPAQELVAQSRPLTHALCPSCVEAMKQARGS